MKRLCDTYEYMIQVVYKSKTRWDPEWHRVQRYIQEAAYTCQTKQGGVLPEYVRLISKDADFIVYKMSDRFPDTVSGFLAGEFKHYKNQVYIRVVCANERGIGKHLVQKALQIGRGLGLKRAGLHALPHVTMYYPRFGFRFPPNGRVRGSRQNGYYMEKNLSNLVNWKNVSMNVGTPPQIYNR